MFVLGLFLAIAIGLSLGLLGGGGSILTVPVFHYVLGAPAHDAITASLVVVGVTSTLALAPHARAGRVRWQTGLVLGASSMAAAYLGGRVSSALPEVALMVAFATLMLVAGVAMLRRTGVPVAVTAIPSVERVLAIGLAVGLLTGVLGVGGGFLIVPALVLIGGLEVRDAVGTSLLVIVLNTLGALAGTAAHTQLEASVLVPITGVAAFGSLLGVHLGRRLSTHQLQRGFGGFVIVMGAAILTFELVSLL
ncbi:MAG TPA: sulfite exporter TauE/SafE family protein [Kofleriaceae bacterium]|jgi:uncharacterized membrane protein YfcA|nr:sulfite exporter TauE/SafE family protein [Kofleriaceae bacterium]